MKDKDIILVEEVFYKRVGLLKRALAYLIDILVPLTLVGLYDLDNINVFVTIIYYLSTMLVLKRTLGMFLLDLKYVKQDKQCLTPTDIILKEAFGRYILETVKPLYLLTFILPQKRNLVEFILGIYLVEEKEVENPLAGYLEVYMKSRENQ